MTKPFYNINGYKAYDIKILGHQCVLHETSSGRFMVIVPMGKTKKIKEMFDNLVYYHQDVYHGKSRKQVIDQVRKFIKNYKK